MWIDTSFVMNKCLNGLDEEIINSIFLKCIDDYSRGGGDPSREGTRFLLMNLPN
jgi:hypothetical protein